MALPQTVYPPAGTGGGPAPRAAAGAEPAVRGAAWAEAGVDGNHFQHPAGDRHPYGILRLQAHLAPVTAKQASPPTSMWEQNKSCCTWVSGEVGIRTLLLGSDLWSGQLVNAERFRKDIQPLSYPNTAMQICGHLSLLLSVSFYIWLYLLKVRPEAPRFSVKMECSRERTHDFLSDVKATLESNHH